MKKKLMTLLVSLALAAGLFGVLPASASKLADTINPNDSSAIHLAAVGDALIVEVNADPVITEPDYEYFELFNTTGSAIDLSNWEICDNSNGGTPAGCRHLPVGTTLGPGRRLVVSFSNAAAMATAYGCAASSLNVVQFSDGWFAGTSGANLANASDRLAVYDNTSPTRVRVDEVSYGTDTTWLNPAAPDVFNNSGQSLQRVGYGSLSFTDTNSSTDWASSTSLGNGNGTPCDVTLAVTLADFYAAQQGDAVLVTWETASELDNRGFNLYRGTSPDGWDRQLNSTLIPSQSQGNPNGFVYTWLDDVDLVPGTSYYYWLQDLDTSGALTMHGPVSVDYTGPTAVTLSGLQASPVADMATLPWLWIVLAAGAALGTSRMRR